MDTYPFRPSWVQDYSRCPQYDIYKNHLGLELPVTVYTPNIDMGSALHAGMAVYWHQRMDTDGQRDPVATALDTLYGLWPQDAPADVTAYVPILERAVRATTRACDDHMSECSPLMIEEHLGVYQGTPDLVASKHGRLGIVDYKFHLEVEERNIRYRTQGIERRHQYKHYAWAVGEIMKRRVEWICQLTVVGMPKTLVVPTVYEPTPESQAEWLRQAKLKWHAMKKNRDGSDLHGGVVYRREEGCLPYGERFPCPYMAACWEMHGSRDKINQFYVRRDG